MIVKLFVATEPGNIGYQFKGTSSFFAIYERKWAVPTELLMKVFWIFPTSATIQNPRNTGTVITTTYTTVLAKIQAF